MDNEWKNSLRERFSDYSAPEPEGLWEGIEQGIAGKPRRKMLPVWLVSGAAVAAAVALVVFLRPEKTADTPVMQEQDRYAESIQTSDEAAPADAAEALPSDSADVLSAGSADETAPAVPSSSKSVPFAVASRQTLLSAATPVPSVPVSDETVPDAVPPVISGEEPVIVSSEDPSVVSSEEPTVISTEDPSVISSEDPPVISSAVEKSPDNVFGDDWPEIQDETVIIGYGVARKRFSIGAYREGGQNATSERSQGYGLNRTAAYLTRVTYNNANQQKSSDLMQMLSNNRASTFVGHHGPPVRVGVSAAWEMSPHLSLVSGLNWTSLTSYFDETTAGETQTSTRQELGYLGIPLRLEAGFEPLKRLRLYAGAGGMVEKGLMSVAKTDSYIGDHLEDSVTGHPDTGGLLWSVGASAGAEYRFARHFGLYLAPGVEYHFDNGAEARSAYTEKPLHWNVALGVRFNFGN